MSTQALTAESPIANERREGARGTRIDIGGFEDQLCVVTCGGEEAIGVFECQTPRSPARPAAPEDFHARRLAEHLDRPNAAPITVQAWLKTSDAADRTEIPTASEIISTVGPFGRAA